MSFEFSWKKQTAESTCLQIPKTKIIRIPKAQESGSFYAFKSLTPNWNTASAPHRALLELLREQWKAIFSPLLTSELRDTFQTSRDAIEEAEHCQVPIDLLTAEYIKSFKFRVWAICRPAARV